MILGSAKELSSKRETREVKSYVKENKHAAKKKVYNKTNRVLDIINKFKSIYSWRIKLFTISGFIYNDQSKEFTKNSH